MTPEEKARRREIEKDDGRVKRRQGEGLQRDGSEKSVSVEEVTIERFELYGWRKHGREPVGAVGEAMDGVKGRSGEDL